VDSRPLIHHFRALDTEEKLELLEILWGDVADNPEALELTETQRRLLDERLRQHAESPDDVLDWDDVQAEALRRIRDQKP
jgi:putative addiction module component (TIGR02574 family)